MNPTLYRARLRFPLHARTCRPPSPYQDLPSEGAGQDPADAGADAAAASAAAAAAEAEVAAGDTDEDTDIDEMRGGKR